MFPFNPSPMFPNTTNTKLWPFGTVKAVQVRDVISKPGALVAAIICADTREDFFIELKRELVPVTRPGDEGTITFRKGGITLGYWEYEANCV